MPSHNPENTVLATKRLVESDKRSEIRLNANGGNCILLVCEPSKELEYITAITKLMEKDTYEIIDLNGLLNKFLEDNADSLKESFELLKGSVHQIFRTPEGEDGNDLFRIVLKAVGDSFKMKRIPVLIHSGALYGTGIDNIHIMENELIMKASLPLIILYPATRDGENLLFLSKRPASRYRCMIVDETK